MRIVSALMAAVIDHPVIGQAECVTGHWVMRKVFEHPAFHEVGHCESILNSHGIATTIRNQDVSSLSGEVPYAAAFPELWVLDDNTYEEAVGLLRDYHDSARRDATRPDWKCSHCGETVPGSFDSCWHCNNAREIAS